MPVNQDLAHSGSEVSSQACPGRVEVVSGAPVWAAVLASELGLLAMVGVHGGLQESSLLRMTTQACFDIVGASRPSSHSKRKVVVVSGIEAGGLSLVLRLDHENSPPMAAGVARLHQRGCFCSSSFPSLALPTASAKQQSNLGLFRL